MRHLEAVVAKPPEAVATLRTRPSRRRRRVQEEVLASIVVKVGHKDLERVCNLAVGAGGIAREVGVGCLVQFATPGTCAAAPNAHYVKLVAHFLATVKVTWVVDSRYSVVVLRS